MPTNKEIREACQSGIENRWMKLLKKSAGGYELEDVESCKLCKIFGQNCTKCVFPGECGFSSNLNSYDNFLNHYKKAHSRYIDGSVYEKGKNEKIVCPECERLVKIIISELEEIIDEHKEEDEHLYSLGDTFKNENRIYSLVETRPGEVQLVDCSRGFCYGANECIIFPKDIDKISFSEINAGTNDFFNFFTHISGPTFEEEEF